MVKRIKPFVLSTREIPQADTLENIVDTVVFVSNGYNSYQLISKKLGVTERQGRYYRLAAELLGFIKNLPGRNSSILTSLGTTFLSSDREQKQEILFTQVFRLPIVQNVIGILAAANGSALQEEISNALLEVVIDSTRIMARRRLQTIISWLGTLGVVTKSGSVIRLINLPNSVHKIEMKDLKMPVLPRVGDIRYFRKVRFLTESSWEIIMLEVEKAEEERNNPEHKKLTGKLATEIRKIGLIPTFNGYIDLAIRINDVSYLVKTKLLNSEVVTNLKTGLLQLNKSRKLQCLPNSKLILLIDRPLSDKELMTSAYLKLKKDLYIICPNNDGSLTIANKEIAKLPFFIENHYHLK